MSMMLGLLLGSLAVALGAAAAFPRSKRMRALARDLQLDLQDGEIAGRMLDLDVRISRQGVEWSVELERSESIPTRFEIDLVGERHRGPAPEAGPRSFAGLNARLDDTGRARWMLLQHDHEAVWGGSEAAALDAFLTDEVRHAFAAAARQGGVLVRDGVVTGLLPPAATAAQFRELVALLAALRTEIERSAAGLFDRLLLLAANGESLELRRHCLEALQRRHGDHPETREASRDATDSPSPELRLAGARFLGVEGVPTLGAVASDGEASESVRVEALRSLAELSPNAARLLLEPLLRRRDSPPALLASAITAATELEHRVVAPAIAALATRVPEVGPRIARALEQLGDASCEPALIALLEVEDDDTPLRAARALTVHGGLTAVEPLLRAARARGRGRGEDLFTAARTIQSRLARDAPGGVSVAGPEDGAVSLASPAEGGVSLVLEPSADEQGAPRAAEPAASGTPRSTT